MLNKLIRTSHEYVPKQLDLVINPFIQLLRYCTVYIFAFNNFNEGDDFGTSCIPYMSFFHTPFCSFVYPK